MEEPQTTPQEEDPWAKLSPEQKRRAERHLHILYLAMALLVLGPLIALFFLRESR